MKKLTSRQLEIQQLILDETRSSGFPPNYKRLLALTGNSSIANICDRIIERGWLQQPYEGGPYIPTRDVDGTPLKLELVRVTSGSAGAP